MPHTPGRSDPGAGESKGCMQPSWDGSEKRKTYNDCFQPAQPRSAGALEVVKG